MDLESLCHNYITHRSYETIISLLNHKESNQLFKIFITWHKQGIFTTQNLYFYIMQLFARHIYLFLSKGREILASIIEYIYDRDINDEWILNLLTLKCNKELQMVCIY